MVVSYLIMLMGKVEFDNLFKKCLEVFRGTLEDMGYIMKLFCHQLSCVYNLTSIGDS